MWIIREDSPHLFLLHISLSRPSDGNADRQKWRSVEPVCQVCNDVEAIPL